MAPVTQIHLPPGSISRSNHKPSSDGFQVRLSRPGAQLPSFPPEASLSQQLATQLSIPWSVLGPLLTQPLQAGPPNHATRCFSVSSESQFGQAPACPLAAPKSRGLGLASLPSPTWHFHLHTCWGGLRGGAQDQQSDHHLSYQTCSLSGHT